MCHAPLSLPTLPSFTFPVFPTQLMPIFSLDPYSGLLSVNDTEIILDANGTIGNITVCLETIHMQPMLITNQLAFMYGTCYTSFFFLAVLTQKNFCTLTHTHTPRLALLSWVQTTPTYHLHSRSTGLPPSVRIRPSQCSLLPPSMLWWGFPSPSTSTPPLLWTTPCPSLTYCSPRKPWLCRAMSRLSPDWEMSKD